MSNSHQGVPETPSRKHPEILEAILKQLNLRYNLGIRPVDLSLSPRKRRERIANAGERAQRIESIQKRIRFLFYSDRLLLNDVLDKFDSKATSILATTAGPAEPVDALQVELVRLLGDVQRTIPFRPSIQRTKSETFETELSSTKRSRGEPPGGQQPKRPRSRQRDGIDMVDMPHRSGSVISAMLAASSPRGARAVQNSPSTRPSALSADTSKATFTSSVFSRPNNDDDEACSSDSFSSHLTEEAGPTEIARRERMLVASDATGSEPESFGSGQLGVGGCCPGPRAGLAAPGAAFEGKHAALRARLDNVWPVLPIFLNHAPFAVCWEFIRIALHCGVGLGELADDPRILSYSRKWHQQTELRASLARHPLFAGKTFPEPCPEAVWEAALSSMQTSDGMHVSFVIDLTWRGSQDGPVFALALQPLKLELGHRLGRRFGPDRFIELSVPSVKTRHSKGISLTASQANVMIRWLSTERHFFAGRQWAGFYTRASKKTVPGDEREGDLTVNLDRVYLFAEDGHSFEPASSFPDQIEASQSCERTKLRLPGMLAWAVALNKNRKQPYLKLFSRLALSLSRTNATVVLSKAQIRHRQENILSPTGVVMNDGIGRMSCALAKMISEKIGLPSTPSGFQGRLGSAKGFWICDQDQMSEEVWIETYPSQRKWECNYEDEGHRTFEVKSPARELKSAAVNLQFIVVLMDRAIRKNDLRACLGDFLRKSLNEELDDHLDAMDDTAKLFSWLDNRFFGGYRFSRLFSGQVDFLGGLPNHDAERLLYLAAGGFKPLEQVYLQERALALMERTLAQAKSKLSVKVGRSAFVFMVVDFLGVLEEGEVHLGFSSKFQTDDFSDTVLHGMDLLVARAPAHFPGDVQRVRAVFRPELRHLKDVVVFSTKGNRPLADKLSGGDYDGDQAWVCWEPSIVNNFQNAEEPSGVPDLFALNYLRKDKQSFGEVVDDFEPDFDFAVAEFMYRSFRFNMNPSLLGECTVYKEKLCYAMGSIDNDQAILLSTLVGHLVDQAKQGIIFGQVEWEKFRKDMLGGIKYPQEPAYKSDRWDMPTREPTHILDYLKFNVAEPMVDELLCKRKDYMAGKGSLTDDDLVRPSIEMKRYATREAANKGLSAVMQNLVSELVDLWEEWKAESSRRGSRCYADNVRRLHDKWCRIEPTGTKKELECVARYFGDDDSKGERSRWSLLKASATFENFVRRNHNFTWMMAGRQLQWIKAASQPEVMAVTMPIWGILRPDRGLAQGLSMKRGLNDGESVIVQDVEFDETGTQLDDA